VEVEVKQGQGMLAQKYQGSILQGIKKKKSIKDYCIYVGSTKQASDY
jgi:hypothetical protein